MTQHTDWRDISSAPKDGTTFQAWVIYHSEHDGLWEPKSRFNPDTEAFEVWGRVDYDRDDWDVVPGAQVVGWLPNPTAPTPPGGDDA